MINCMFQGYFDLEKAEGEQVLEGSGIVLDDEFNFFAGEWHSNCVNGLHFVSLSGGMVVLG